MTGRTHDLAAFTALSFVVSQQQPGSISLGTLLVALTANMIGGLAPDIDQPTSVFWNRIPAGSVIGRLVTPFLSGHRHVSHSLLGIALFGLLFRMLLDRASTILLVDMNSVWWAFMIGYVSHLIMDTLTTEGVPWLFPLPFKFGIPPFKFMRVKTGGAIEKLAVFPLLLLISAYTYYAHYRLFVSILKHSVK